MTTDDRNAGRADGVFGAVIVAFIAGLLFFCAYTIGWTNGTAEATSRVRLEAERAGVGHWVDDEDDKPDQKFEWVTPDAE